MTEWMPSCKDLMARLRLYARSVAEGGGHVVEHGEDETPIGVAHQCTLSYQGHTFSVTTTITHMEPGEDPRPVIVTHGRE